MEDEAIFQNEEPGLEFHREDKHLNFGNETRNNGIMAWTDTSEVKLREQLTD